MRRLLTLLVLLPACREPAHISVKLALQCPNAQTGMTNFQSCNEMGLECATHVEVRLYEAKGDQLGNILGSKCIAVADFSPQLQTLCDLQNRQDTLIDTLPDGKTVRFRFRALRAFDSRNGCNDDIPGAPPMITVFDGFSAPVPIDGASHTATIDINQCGSCRDLPPPCTGGQCPPFMCPPGQSPYSYPNSGSCCAVGCKNCDPATNPMCGVAPSNCDATGNCVDPNGVPQVCPDGSMPFLPPNSCCPICGMGPQPPTTMPDGGLMGG
jgi:hypothetical protein